MTIDEIAVLFPVRSQFLNAVSVADNGLSCMVAVEVATGVWELSDEGKRRSGKVDEIPLAYTSADKVQSVKKRGKKPAHDALDDLDI